MDTMVLCAYTVLSLWLPGHFDVTVCPQSYLTCLAEEASVFWLANASGSSLLLA